MEKKKTEGKLPRRLRQRKPAPLALRIIGRVLSFIGGPMFLLFILRQRRDVW